MKYNKQVANDAGLLRQYIVEHYGQVLTDGGAMETMNRAMRQVRRLARLTGIGEMQILRDIWNDYAVKEIQEAVHAEDPEFISEHDEIMKGAACPDCGGDCETLLAALKTSLAGGAR